MLYVLINRAGKHYPEKYIKSIKERGIPCITCQEDDNKRLLVKLETMEDFIALYLAVGEPLTFSEDLGEDEVGAHYSIIIYD